MHKVWKFLSLKKSSVWSNKNGMPHHGITATIAQGEVSCNSFLYAMGSHAIFISYHIVYILSYGCQLSCAQGYSGLPFNHISFRWFKFVALPWTQINLEVIVNMRLRFLERVLLQKFDLLSLLSIRVARFKLADIIIWQYLLPCRN